MELKQFDTRDGLGIAMACRAGLKVAIITGRVSEAVTTRAGELGIKDLFQGNMNKLEVYESLLKKHHLTDQQVAFVGDDLLDLQVMKRVGLKPNQAAAYEVAASTGGQIMPPVMGAAAFIMAEFTRSSYLKIVLIALVPAVLFYLSLAIYGHLTVLKMGIRVTEEDIRSYLAEFKRVR